MVMHVSVFYRKGLPRFPRINGFKELNSPGSLKCSELHFPISYHSTMRIKYLLGLRYCNGIASEIQIKEVLRNQCGL